MGLTVEIMVQQIIEAVPGDFVLDFTRGEWVCLYGLSPMGEGGSFILGRHIAPTMREAIKEAWVTTRQWEVSA